MADERSQDGPWARRPLEGKAARRWDIVRCKAGKQIVGIMLAGDLVGAYTHWWGGRTTPCDGVGCLPCSKNVELRWHGYLPLFSVRSNETVIVEVTDGVVEVFDRRFSEHRTLRGSLVTIGRPGSKANGELRAKIEDGPLPSNVLPAAPDVRQILERMWGQAALKRKQRGLAAELGELHIDKYLRGQKVIGDELFTDQPPRTGEGGDRG